MTPAKPGAYWVGVSKVASWMVRRRTPTTSPLARNPRRFQRGQVLRPARFVFLTQGVQGFPTVDAAGVAVGEAQ